ncbi:uncharacterized protein METZ01_LOCUS116532 [marine metagenome]|uniref:Uncharacterized protein n=1 Tax=marine metagenome TaxID=408172 RepID=A0A381XG25_9ZZZZ
MASSIFPGAADWALTSLAKEAATGARKSDLLLSMVITIAPIGSVCAWMPSWNRAPREDASPLDWRL